MKRERLMKLSVTNEFDIIIAPCPRLNVLQFELRYVMKRLLNAGCALLAQHVCVPSRITAISPSICCKVPWPLLLMSVSQFAKACTVTSTFKAIGDQSEGWIFDTLDRFVTSPDPCREVHFLIFLCTLQIAKQVEMYSLVFRTRIAEGLHAVKLFGK